MVAPIPRMVMALRNGRTNALDADTGAADTGAAEMTTLRIGKLIYCDTNIRHDLVCYDKPAQHFVWRFWWSD